VYKHREGIQGTQGVQEEHPFFLFDAMCGRSALRYRFDGEPTEWQKRIGDTKDGSQGSDETADILFGFAGYDYSKLTDTGAFKAAIAASIDAGRPVIANVKAEGTGRFRVIIGYDGKKILEADYNETLRWHKEPKKAVKPGDLLALYIIGEKTAPRYTVLDGLRRIVEIMEYNASEKLWDSFIEQFTDAPPAHMQDSCFYAVDNKEKQVRMKHLEKTMWSMNGYSIRSGFGADNHEALRHPAFDALRKKMDRHYGETFDLDYSLIGLAECADWTKHSYSGGFIGKIVELALRRIQDNEAAVLEAMKQTIAILEQGETP
jgi:hypothetical protein